MSTTLRNHKEYRTVDKSGWGFGAWQDEPDKVQWIDDATGLDCLIVRGPSGALCGYVGVAEGHPFHGKDYGQCAAPTPCEDSWCGHSPGSRMEVHGGLTFADFCAHTEDEARHVCHVPEPGRPDRVWWLGFDCAHSGDVCPKHDADFRSSRYGWETYKTLGYVHGEVESLARQLAEVAAT